MKKRRWIFLILLSASLYSASTINYLQGKSQKQAPIIDEAKNYQFNKNEIALYSYVEIIETGDRPVQEIDYDYERERFLFHNAPKKSRNLSCYFEPTLYKVYKYRKRIISILEDMEYVDNELIILGVIAQESSGRATLVSEDGHNTTGLMQISPRYGKNLKNSNTNILIGMHLLDSIMTHYRGFDEIGGYQNEYYSSKDFDSTWFWSLSAYNCGYVSVDTGKCYSFGGPTYAERVLNCWTSAFEEFQENHFPENIN